MGSWGLSARGRNIRTVVVDYLTGAEFAAAGVDSQTIVSGPTRHDGAWWAIMRRADGTPYLACVLARRYGDTVNIKGMDVTVGPAYDAPPGMFAAYAKLRPEPENKWESDWRARQGEYRPPARLRPGQQVRFSQPLWFTDGTESRTLTFVRGYLLRREDGRLVRLPRSWRTVFAWDAA